MSSAMVGNGYPPNYNTYNSQPSPSHGQNLITTGVLSYSDERHQQLQDMLGSQRQKEYNQYLQKQEGYYDPHPSSRPPANEQQHYRSSPSQPHSVQTTPRRGVFYRLVSPDGGLPLGQYEEQRKYLDEQRQRDYLKMMSQKEKQEYQKREEEKVQKQVRDQKAQMQKQEQEKKLYNYNKVQKQFQEERRKDYEEFVPMGGIPRRGKYFPALESLTLAEKKYREYLRNQQTDEESDSSAELDINDHSNRRKSRRSKDSDSEEDKPRTPLPWDSTLFEGKHTDEFLARGGIPRRRKQKYTRKSGRAKERQNEYMAFLQSKENNPSPRRAPTPPNGLDIVTQDERTRMAREKQRQYGQELQRQTQEQMLQKIHNNIPVIDRTGQQPAGPNQYNHFPPQQHMMAPPPQYRASPPPSNVPSHPPHQSMSPPQQHSQQHQMQGSHRNHNHGTPAGSQSPPPRHRSHATPQRTEHGGYFPEFNGKQQSPLESRDGHRPPPHPRRYATPDRPDWARGPQRQNGTPTARSSHRRDDRQTPSYWNAGVPVKSPATTPSTRAPSTQQSNRTLTPKDSQDMIPDLHLESFRKDPMLDRRKEERNREYNKFLDEEHNREQQRREKLENLRKQPAVQPKYDNYSNSDNHERHRHNLESERRGEYQSFLSKNGEPVYPYARNPSSDLALSRLSGGLVGGIFGDVQHETDRRRAMINQRNKEYNELKKQLPQKTVRHIPSGGSRKEVDFENQKAFPMGNDYAEKQKKLREEWRKSYEIQMEKVGHSTYKKKSYTPQVQIQISKEEGARSQRDDSFRQSWERSMETPPIVPAGIYDQKRLQINAKMQADYQVYLASQQPVNRSKEFWGTNDNPRIYPTSGEYKKRGEKMKEELREEFHSFMDKQEPPKERKKVFGDQGSVLFVSKYPDTKKHMNAERRKEMIDYLEKKNGEVPRRQGDPSVDEKNMFSDMGKAQEAHSRRMQENARQDYKNYVDHAFPEGLNRGQPSFAAGKQPPDSWYSAQPPTHRYSPPRDLGPEQNGQKSNDPYTERLQQARANEAMYRRHDHEMNGQSQRAPPPRQEAPYALH
ncbi:trichohyalin-like isoform X41 [Argopecten irradians]|uniref:trichohyalin-like isoform X41 n=1 Tax=Argopecten irradians TaxID=31199 RepID=UPI00371CA7D0